MRQLNWTTIALIGGLVLLLLLVAYFATGRNADQDKLTDGQVSNAAVPSGEKACASKSTYDLIKRELFRRAAQLRGSDQAAYDRLSAYASLRMENPVMESENAQSKAVTCAGSLSLDLPPGVVVVGGRRSLSADVDYTVQPAADGSGPVVLLRNADSIITPLATLARTAAQPSTPQAPQAPQAPSAPAAPEPTGDEPAPPPVPAAPPAPPPPPTSSIEPGPTARAPTTSARPSFNCANARTSGERAVCRDSGLASLDRQMAAEFFRARGVANAEQRALLDRTRTRFLAYRDRCSSDACIADAYRGRIAEIRDIMAGRWQPQR
ncbi:MAG TPA: hypothetical protein VM308_04395 [Sphingomicrobium sp.]|nr:hypothetical protein [Sphingomicrobium sp.]